MKLFKLKFPFSSFNGFFFFLSTLIISYALLYFIYIKLFTYSWNQVISKMFDVPKISFIQAVAFLFLVSTISSILFRKK